MDLLDRWESALDTDQAVEAFLEAIDPSLNRILARFQIPPEDAEDLVQQALLALVYQWDIIRDHEAWLVGTLKNRCLVYRRERRRRLYRAVDEVILECMADGTRPEQERVELARDLNDLLARLPHRTRQLLSLRYGHGYEPAELASLMGYSPASIAKLTQRSLAALSREMVRSGFSSRPFQERLTEGGEQGS